MRSIAKLQRNGKEASDDHEGIKIVHPDPDHLVSQLPGKQTSSQKPHPGNLGHTRFHQDGHRHVEFPRRPWYPKKKEPSFGDMLTTLRRLSWTELWQGALGNEGRIKEIFTQITEFVSRAG